MQAHGDMARKRLLQWRLGRWPLVFTYQHRFSAKGIQNTTSRLAADTRFTRHGFVNRRLLIRAQLLNLCR